MQPLPAARPNGFESTFRTNASPCDLRSGWAGGGRGAATPGAGGRRVTPNPAADFPVPRLTHPASPQGTTHRGPPPRRARCARVYARATPPTDAAHGRCPPTPTCDWLRLPGGACRSLCDRLPPPPPLLLPPRRSSERPGALASRPRSVCSESPTRPLPATRSPSRRRRRRPPLSRPPTCLRRLRQPRHTAIPLMVLTLASLSSPVRRSPGPPLAGTPRFDVWCPPRGGSAESASYNPALRRAHLHRLPRPPCKICMFVRCGVPSLQLEVDDGK